MVVFRGITADFTMVPALMSPDLPLQTVVGMEFAAELDSIVAKGCRVGEGSGDHLGIFLFHGKGLRIERIILERHVLLGFQLGLKQFPFDFLMRQSLVDDQC